MRAWKYEVEGSVEECVCPVLYIFAWNDNEIGKLEV